MPNKAASIGFAGTESYDLILYLAVMLTALDKKVLLVDNSCHKALSCCIPVSDITGREKVVHYKGLDIRREKEVRYEGVDLLREKEVCCEGVDLLKEKEVCCEGVDLLRKKDVRYEELDIRREKEICYMGVDISKDTPLVTLEGEYDFILMDFGQNISHKDIKACDSLCLVTDTGLHNIAVIEPLKAAVEDVYLLIREIPNRLDENYILKLINEKGILGKKSFYFYFDEADKEAMTALQYYNSVSYKRLSPAIKYFLKELSREAFGMNERQVKLAEKKLGRRR
ncbi:hypothetical protein SAMN02745136_00865 [Anaerocolumna jejuensis DSM 15929]|uniref:Uncharacterized protein n=1 Tax=Anaerocolumna jejuensis DSM 15929 TaxID=1121322 RepID=A0A1M6M6B6_9FIRM|nr:hypothetical protein [Anaerocolumna jejuensis]SHJ79016.1 hypothetical protein SAMN02745136_00865 [Anaerocolumna jejuensis DSM 15929]